MSRLARPRFLLLLWTLALAAAPLARAGAGDPIWRVVPGLLPGAAVASSVRESQGRCRLPRPDEFARWSDAASRSGQPPERGLYWVAPASDREAGYGLYVHWPTRQVVEYGSLMFDAHLVLVCSTPSSAEIKPQGVDE